MLETSAANKLSASREPRKTDTYSASCQAARRNKDHDARASAVLLRCHTSLPRTQIGCHTPSRTSNVSRVFRRASSRTRGAVRLISDHSASITRSMAVVIRYRSELAMTACRRSLDRARNAAKKSLVTDAKPLFLPSIRSECSMPSLNS